MAGLVAACLQSCAAKQIRDEPASPQQPSSADQAEAVKVMIGPPSEVRELVGTTSSAKCRLDAMKICETYGQAVSAEGDTRTVSLQIPNSSAVAVQCQYSGQGGRLVAAKPSGEVLPNRDAEAFLRAHGFCAAAGP